MLIMIKTIDIMMSRLQSLKCAEFRVKGTQGVVEDCPGSSFSDTADDDANGDDVHDDDDDDDDDIRGVIDGDVAE